FARSALPGPHRPTPSWCVTANAGCVPPVSAHIDRHLYLSPSADDPPCFTLDRRLRVVIHRDDILAGEEPSEAGAAPRVEARRAHGPALLGVGDGVEAQMDALRVDGTAYRCRDR